ncbi:MAG: hypothetical protein IKA95_03930 [Clostridia bacterium]|nr:hypothetical protein [Clostridia bacterium]
MKKFLSNILVFALVLAMVQIPSFSVMAAEKIDEVSFTGEAKAYELDGTTKTITGSQNVTLRNSNRNRCVLETVDTSVLKDKDLSSVILRYSFVYTHDGNTIELRAGSREGQVLATKTFDKADGTISAGLYYITFEFELLDYVDILTAADTFTFSITCSDIASGGTVVAYFTGCTEPNADYHPAMTYKYDDGGNVPYTVSTPDIALDKQSATVTVTVNDLSEVNDLKFYLAAYDLDGGIVLKAVSVSSLPDSGAWAEGENTLTVEFPEAVSATYTYAFVWDYVTPVAVASV